MSWTIAPSPIHGLGVFAASSIPRGTLIGLAHVLSPAIGAVPSELYVRTERGDVAQVAAPFSGWAATRLGRYYNHSETPNATSEPGRDGRSRWLVAARDVRPGEEVTVDYRGWTEAYRAGWG